MSWRSLVAGLVLACGFAETAAAEDSLPFALEVWDNAARLATPTWLKAWLGFLAFSFVASLAFVKHHGAARWALGGFAASHTLVVLLGVTDGVVLRRGLVSLLHVLCWAPALPPLVISALRDDDFPRFRVWCGVLAAVIATAFVFDLRDGASYLYHWLSGHPAFDG